MKRYILLLLAFLTAALQVSAQEIIENDDENSPTTDTLFADTIPQSTLSLPWPQSAVVHIDRLLQNDMFNTSQVGIMVYDLDADSVIYRHNERQLMRPASTMKLITAITAIDKLGGSYQFKTDLCYTGVVENGTLKGNWGFQPLTIIRLLANPPIKTPAMSKK